MMLESYSPCEAVSLTYEGGPSYPVTTQKLAQIIVQLRDTAAYIACLQTNFGPRHARFEAVRVYER